MKRLFVTMSDETEMNDDMKKRVEQFAREHNATPLGVIQYPEGLPVMIPQVIIEGIKTTKADYIMSASTDFLISEVVHDCLISKTLAKEGIEVYEADFGLRFEEVMNQVSPQMKSDLKGLLNDKIGITQDKKEKSILLIAKERSPIEIYYYAQELLIEREISSVGNFQVYDFDKKTANQIRQIIKEDHVNEVIFYDEFDTQEYDELLDELKQNDIEITYSSPAQNRLYAMSMN